MFFVLLFALPLSAQKYIAKVEHFGVEQGLSHRQVNSICKDKRGFLWIGTPYGLNRFDGHNFRWYTKSKDGLPFDDIQAIHLDSEGWLWIFNANFTELFFYKPETGEIKTREARFGKAILPNDLEDFWRIRSSYFSDDLLFAFYQTPIFYIWRHSEGFRKVEVKGCAHFVVENFASDSTIWGVNRGDGQSDTLLEVDLNGNILRRFPGKIWSSLGPDKTFFIANEPNLQRYYQLGNGEQATPLTRSIPHIPGVTFWPEDGGIIINSIGQIYYQLDGALLYDLKEKCNRPRCMFTDFNGTVWLGGDYGLYLLSIKPGNFQNVFYEKHNNDLTFGKAIRGIAVMGDHVFANLESEGFWELDRRTLQTRLIARHAMERGKASVPAYYAVFADPFAGDVYSGAGESLLRYSPASGVIKKWALPLFKQIWAIGRVSPPGSLPGVLLLGGGGNRGQQGLFLLDESKDSIESFRAYNGYDELKNATVQTIKMDRLGQVWLCASTGLYKFDLQKGFTDRYWSQGTGGHYLPADNVQHFHEDADGTFWIGSGYEGLLHWDPRTGVCQKITRAEGLSNNNIYAVYEDVKGRLWLPSDYGLMQFDKKTGHVKAWLSGDGIPHNEFNRLAHAQAPDGQLFFGGLNGITMFYPGNFYDNPSDAEIPLELSGCTVFNAAQNKLLDKLTEVWATNTLTLMPDDVNFSLAFALLDFEQTAQNLYAWKIEKRNRSLQDDIWHFQKENQVSLGRLPYGNYTLRIRGQAADGQWSKLEKTIRIWVVRPFYASWWFWLLLLALAVLGIRHYVRWRTASHQQEALRLEREVVSQTATIRKQTEALQHLDEMKSNFFANLSHELRTPLSLLLGPIGTALKRNRLENQDFTLIKLAQTHAKQLLQLVNQILDLSKLESRKLGLSETPTLLYPLSRRIAAAFESHAEQRGIRFVFQYQLEKNLCLLVDAAKLETILNNLLSNALKFTPQGGTVSVKVESLAHAVRLTVSDTGRGIHPDDLPHIFNRFYQSEQPNAPSEGGTGIGLALCNELAELMLGKVWAESPELGAGSRFFFQFPQKEILGAVDASGWETQVEEEESPDAAIKTSAAPQNKEATVLVVEDNKSLRDYIQLILSERYHVVTAENGQIALNFLNAPKDKSHNPPMLESPNPQLIISDIMMPVMDGFQLLENLKSNAQYRQIPVIMLTARADMHDKLRALRIGVDDYLLKPFEEEELLARVAVLLEGYREREHWRQESMSADAVDAEEHLSESETREHTAYESAWLEELETLVSQEVQNDQLSVSWLADRLHLSERHLLRRINLLTGLTPNAYIKEVRLQEARRLLEQRLVQTLKEVAWAVSFRDEKYFSQIFRERFGKSPSDLLR